MDIIVVMLCVLYVLHLDWFWLIISTFIRALFGGRTKDVRSDTDDEDGEGTQDERQFSECKQ